jgi:hypothetical protein
MSDKNKTFLASFMKKQINDKASKISIINQSIIGSNNSNDSNEGDDQEQEKPEEKLSEEEEKEKKELEQAKLASKMKASQMDQTQMLKKLLIQNTVKLVLIIGSMLILAYGVIEIGPQIISSMNGVLIKAVVNSSK